MRTIKIIIHYDGTGYAGWQTQSNANSIQETIEAALAKITGSEVKIVGSGRTDSGVHAKGQVASFRTHSKLPLSKLQYALNSILPDDIIIVSAREERSRFNARFDAKSKVYRYTICTTSPMSPFLRHFSTLWVYRIDLTAMRKAATYLVGRHDFRSFQAIAHNQRASVRKVKRIRIARRGPLVYIDIEADGFLHTMVRVIVGTLLEVGRKRMKPEYLHEILLSKDRRLAGPTAPARGLCLMKVTY